MHFANLSLSKWKQFNNIDITFHDRVTILTGANGAGKTTILNILSRHFGWAISELSSPIKDESTGGFHFRGHLFRDESANKVIIGTLLYNNRHQANLTVPKDAGAPKYDVSYQDALTVSGLHIPSHRQTYNYSKVANISTNKRSQNDALNLSRNSYQAQYEGRNTQTSNYFIKETLLGWAIAGRGNEFIQPNNELIGFFKGFQETLKKVLPKSLGFKKISIRDFEIVLETKTGDFLLDAASGGISSIIDLAWQIYNNVVDKKERSVVLIDEVENHLHPSMQREILQALVDGFGKVQFIVTTHSPLVVTSVKDSTVYALRYNQDRKVESQKLDFSNEVRNANEILDEVLGVRTTLPVWVENQFNTAIKSFESSEITPTSIATLKSELTSLGLSQLFVKTLNEGLKKND